MGGGGGGGGGGGEPGRRGGSGVPSPGGEVLVCPLQEGRFWCAPSKRG